MERPDTGLGQHHLVTAVRGLLVLMLVVAVVLSVMVVMVLLVKLLVLGSMISRVHLGSLDVLVKKKLHEILQQGRAGEVPETSAKHDP